jgi:hypothetical protein
MTFPDGHNCIRPAGSIERQAETASELRIRFESWHDQGISWCFSCNDFGRLGSPETVSAGNHEEREQSCKGQEERSGFLNRQSKPGKHSQHFHSYDHEHNSENYPEPV